MIGVGIDVVVTIGLIVASAFFVSVEFAVIASRRPRLEAMAATSASARAALRSAEEVSVLLAGCQLGITACTLALGAVTKPAVQSGLTPLLDAVGLPGGAAYVVSFVLALLLVTFLHLVVGEMAPKSWAIAHPERSASLFAIPMRGFMWVFRPVLLLINEAANGLVRRGGVEPVAEVAIEQDPDDLKQLVLHSAASGDLDDGSSEQLSAALDAFRLTVGEVVRDRPPVLVAPDASVADVQDASLDSGHLRILVGEVDDPTGVVHLRDLLALGPDEPVVDHVRDLRRLDADTTVLDALDELRAAGDQIARVDGPRGPAVLTVADLLSRLMPATAGVERVG